MPNLYVKAAPPTDLNRNTEWFTYPGVWSTYILILFFSWLVVLSVFGCSPGMAWTIVHLSHFIITYHFFHWKKGTPFADDQGIYNRLTWWEQIDNGKQLTRNRKFLTVVPVVLYLIASHTTDYQHPMLFLNTVAVFVLVVAKFPHMHKVRIFGINADQWVRHPPEFCYKNIWNPKLLSQCRVDYFSLPEQSEYATPCTYACLNWVRVCKIERFSCGMFFKNDFYL